MGEAVGKWASAKLGTYTVTLNFAWRDSKWLATTIGTQWTGKEGYGKPDKNAAMTAVTRILSKLDLPTAPD
ncbi:MAG: hypothetical protein Q8L55_09295 [Phycisphaerales bacterium]|nr:hypothetical protein [Phycisphaerales bacterium]